MKRNSGAGVRSKLYGLVHHPYFTNTVLFLIFINSITIGLETYPGIFKEYQNWFVLIEGFFLWFFTIEIILRIIAHRPMLHFFKNGWNIFDFIIIGGVLIFSGTHYISALRILRVLRVMRTVSVSPSLQRLTTALLRTVPAMANILLLLAIVFYVFAVIGVILYRDLAPEYFGSLHLSMVTLFQVVTLESWASGVFRPIFEEDPWSWIYFISFILIGTFIVLNLFVGEIVNNVQKVNEMYEAKKKEKEGKKEVDHEMLLKGIAELKAMIKENQDNK